MGALPANLSIDSMFRVLALLCLAVLSRGEPEAEPKAVADPKADPYLLYGGYYGLGLDIMGATTATLTTATTERDLLTLSLFLLLVLMPKLKQTPATDTTDTVLVTMAMAMDTMAIPTCMARGLPMPRLNLLPKLRLTRIFFMATMDLDIIMGAIMATRTMAMATVTTMASKKGRDPIES